MTTHLIDARISHIRRITSVSLLSAAAALASNTASAQESAQRASKRDASGAPLEEVIVTGIRYSIATSVDVKLDADSIVESISAEDIGKLPDVSIADSIARLPGLTTQRVDGRSQVINVRGMSEQFVGTLLNGREQVSTGDSRGVEFDQYPAELINAVVVYKTADAHVIGQGLSATVDLQTVKPLSIGKRRMTFGVSGEYNSLGSLSDDGDDKGYRASASYVDQFADDTIGVALGVARLDSPFQEKHYKEWWWGNTDAFGSPQAGVPTDALALQGSELWVKSRSLVRTGAMGVLELKPNDVFHSTLDGYYSKFNQGEVMHGAMWANDPFWNDGVVSYSGATTTSLDGNSIVTGGTLDGVQPVVRNDDNKRQDKLYSAGWNNEVTLDAWSFGVDLSYSKAKRDQSTLESYAGLLGPQSIGFDIPIDARFGRYTLPDLADASAVLLWDPQGWGHDGRIEDSEQTDSIKAARLSLRRSFESLPVISSIEAGANFNRRTKKKQATVYFADLVNGRAPSAVDGTFLQSPVSLGFGGVGRVLAFDARDALTSSLYDLTVSEDRNDLRKDYKVEEDVDTYYLQANLKMPVGDSIELRGNVGVQYIRTDQSSTGFNAHDPTHLNTQTLGRKYTDTLPSLNLVADFGSGWIARLGAAKTLTRPPINYLSADSDAGVDTFGFWSGSGGNPKLLPYRAHAYDLSLEKYFGAASYAAIAGFYKDLKTYIYRSELPWDFSAYDPEGRVPVSNIGTFNTWANGKGGRMRGVEGTLSLTGDLIAPALTGFGVQFNVSYTKSSIDPDGPDGSTTDTIPGLSKIITNSTLYYERYGFGARLSHRYRDDYRGEYASLFGQRTYRYTLSESQFDLQLSYDFQKGSRLEGLSLLFQVYNLNNSPFRTTVTDANGLLLTLPEEYTKYGRQFLLGVRYGLE